MLDAQPAPAGKAVAASIVANVQRGVTMRGNDVRGRSKLALVGCGTRTLRWARQN